jgi:hypothetical protein
MQGQQLLNCELPVEHLINSRHFELWIYAVGYFLVRMTYGKRFILSLNGSGLIQNPASITKSVSKERSQVSVVQGFLKGCENGTNKGIHRRARHDRTEKKGPFFT